MLPLLRPFSRGSVPQWNNALELIQKRTMAAPAAPTTAVEGRGHGDATPDRKELIQRVLHIRRTTRMSRAGKVRSMYAMVVVGNGNGGAGYGEGKSTDLGGAVQKAVKRAQRDMMVINRYDNRTIFGTIVHKYVGSEITLRPAPPGYGISANSTIHEICRCAGIQDISAKVVGSMNPMNVVKGTFEALQLQQKPEAIARKRGRKLVDVLQQYYGSHQTQ